jgi:uncharacterized membrane protein (UPF0127 family)
MKIINKTRKTAVSEDAREARSVWSRIRGLMFTKRPQTLVLVSPQHSIADSSIHMWFMRQPIDVIWLDNDFKAVDLYENARPWAFRIFRPKVSAKYVVECPAGTIRESKTKEKDVFSFPGC